MNSDKEIFDAIALKVSKITGVQLGVKQESLVFSRLSKHLRNLGGMTPRSYWDFLNANETTEMPVLISLLTTHHSYFFREKMHFDYLARELPEIVRRLREKNRKTLRVWCAACSRGQEGYTIAMFLDYHLKILAPELDYQILFSDVDQESVKIAREANYPADDLSKVPLNFRSNHWQREDQGLRVSARDSLLKHCEFRVVNLLHLDRLFLREKFDIIFCRNVFIYFTPEQVEQVSRQLLSRLEEKGHYIIGVSESLFQMRLPLKLVGQSIYRKLDTEQTLGFSPALESKARTELHIPKAPPIATHVDPKALRVNTPVSLPQTLENLSPSTDQLIAIGASTGGTEAITQILRQLPAHMPPIVIVQHIPEGFSRTFAERLDQVCALKVKEAKDGDVLQRGEVYIAPGNRHMQVVGRPGAYRLRVFDAEKQSGHRPSVNVLFQSVAQVAGANAVALILTGMGADGADGLLSIRQQGGTTFGQDEASSIVYGMPKAAFQKGAVGRVVALADIPHLLLYTVQKAANVKTLGGKGLLKAV